VRRQLPARDAGLAVAEGRDRPVMTMKTNHPIVLFDGVCNFCNGSINFIIRRDRSKIFRFAPLQSKAGAKVLRQFGLPPDWVETIVLVEDGGCYTRSTAALRIVRRLGGPWSILYVLRVIPAAARDTIYDLIARNRYRWFGRKNACMIPTPEVRERFLEGVDHPQRRPV
jgi:predicted DCC family thiol-disulfide oxidoreductase YuxK